MILLWGFIIQLIFLVAIFDIYFKSPIIHGIQSADPLTTPPAKRLVLFIADGLRYESFMSRGHAPKLKSIANNEGVWGMSNTRVPTESRPGHVALIAGFYEDPSAVAKGWKENPVDFDSVFNRSRYTWCWGSPDICHIFTKPNHVYSHVYLEKEDFSGKSSTIELDKWVFDKVRQFFDNAKRNNGLFQQLNEDRIILAFHLLGLDTAGHTHKPGSRDFNLNLEYLDNQVPIAVTQIETFFKNDGKTAYIFTSDHGMTDWGSHGAGDPHETQTPIIAWGAGINNPTNVGKKLNSEVYEHRRFDINQADVAPLMSTLIGAVIPGNSIGVLPKNFLNMTSADIVKAVYTNAKQMICHYKRMREIIEENALQFLYEPFELLTDGKIEEITELADRMLEKDKHLMLEILSNETIELSLKGINYYHNYYQRFLLMSVSLAYIGWIVCLITYLLPQKATFKNALNISLNADSTSPRLLHIQRKASVMNVFFVTLAAVIMALNILQRFPIMYHVYCILPLFLWWNVFSAWKIWLRYITYGNYCNINLFKNIILYLIGLESLVSTFFQRWTLSFGLFGIIFWNIWSYKDKSRQIRKSMYWWCISCLILTMFVFLPVIGNNSNITILMLSSILIIINNLANFYYDTLLNFYKKKYPWKDVVMSLCQISILFITILNIYAVDSSIQNKHGLTPVNQLISWISAVIGLILPLFRSRYILSRLTGLYSSFSVLYLLLSVSHEGMFLLVLNTNLFAWAIFEYRLLNGNSSSFSALIMTKRLWIGEETNERPLNANDFKRSYIFLLFIILSFFGTGNIASLNSFEVQWVRCFVTKFSPFVITPLILCKTMIPFLCVAVTFNTINFLTKAPVKQIMLIFLIFSNFMALHFLYFVKNTGSWLEIGTSISHYVIMHLTILFIYVLHSIANFLTRVELLPLARDTIEREILQLSSRQKLN